MSTRSISDWVIELTFPDLNQNVRANVKPELVIGRMDSADQNGFTGLDMTPFQGVDLGISRRHALIRWENNHLVLVDLGSNNGTIQNGVRLHPDAPYTVTDGDTLYIGHLQATLRINAEIGKSFIPAKRIEYSTSNIPMAARG